MIRFNIYKDNAMSQTDWEEEQVTSGPNATSVARMTQLRKMHGPEARISVERDPVPRRQSQEWVQFILTFPGGATSHSAAVLKSQADALQGDLAKDYPKAEISRREWVK